jgi:5-methylcytosine-specific restriction endonuclease McrA
MKYHHAVAHGESLTLQTSECEVCGTTFEYYESNDKCGKFCSRECYQDDGEMTVSCDWCGGDITRQVNRLTRSSHHFCSKECRGSWLSRNITGEDHPQWNGGNSGSYGAAWRQVRRAVLERDGGRCCSCGTKEDLEVHHEIPLSTFDNPERANQMTNLVTLCSSCHSEVEASRKPEWKQ